jgi:hypothetical protein
MFNKNFYPFRENMFHINLVRKQFEKKAVMTISQHNDKKHNASTVKTTSEHFGETT